MSGAASSYGQLFLWQVVTALGLGAIATVGFSVISDFVSPRRRGLAMSFWGLSQGIGGLFDLFTDARTPDRHGADLGPDMGSLREKEASE